LAWPESSLARSLLFGSARLSGANSLRWMCLLMRSRSNTTTSSQLPSHHVGGMSKTSSPGGSPDEEFVTRIEANGCIGIRHAQCGPSRQRLAMKLRSDVEQDERADDGRIAPDARRTPRAGAASHVRAEVRPFVFTPKRRTRKTTIPVSVSTLNTSAM